ncbi:BNR/Asp-box repeat protein [Teratosphaeria nubilosa]|uniref:BNR/Asp-box repeat protein n=1 Tax=Teratosphaeria nubilosa TaxID=161662 RepID=A0A6G1LCL7_9PEZI|nr:BNR/Asp-box repeat protein [Teratosphaeria nubilosa]
MLLNSLAISGAIATAASALLTNVTIFTPPSNYTIPRTLYARTLLLSQENDTESTPQLLATWENYGPNNNTNPYFPIYQSFDLGATWSERSRVYDQVNGWGLRYQPFLYELPEDFACFKKGTVLLAGNSIPQDLSQTQIDVYASEDQGTTWKFVSHVARGGEALPDNGLSPVWEPFLLMYEGQLVIYYSDQRDPAYGQKLVHQVTSDLVTWGPVVDDVAYSTYDDRPGMTTVSALPNGQWIITYEFYGAPEAAFAVYYRLSDSPLTFNNATGYVIEATDGTIPVSSPYNVWTPSDSKNGSIVVSCGTLSTVFINHDLAAPGSPWVEYATPEGTSYTRSLLVLPDPDQILITGGGVLSGTDNRVTTSSIDITAAGE